MRILTFFGLAMLTAASTCTTTQIEGSKAVRVMYYNTLSAWNSAGVDPSTLSEKELLFAGAGCGTLTALSTVYDPSAPEMSAEVGEWCAAAVALLAPAQLPEQ